MCCGGGTHPSLHPKGIQNYDPRVVKNKLKKRHVFLVFVGLGMGVDGSNFVPKESKILALGNGHCCGGGSLRAFRAKRNRKFSRLDTKQM